MIEIIIFIWLGISTFLLFRTITNYNRLTKGVSEKTLSEVLSDFLKQDKQTQEALVKIHEQLKQQEKDSLKALQKIGLVRFNPFADTGGDQSFVIALLDGNDDGIVLTSLYSRTGVRWYLKTVRKGKGIEHELSKEEKEAITHVRKVKT